MIGNMFAELQSNNLYPEKDSMCTSNLHTAITTQFDNVSFDICTNEQFANESDNAVHQENSPSSDHPVNEIVNYRKGREYFQNSLSFKLQELEEKSSKIITKLPDLHNKILKAQTYPRHPIEHPFLSTSSIYGNKLKIIRDLEQKIGQLETNINNPLNCHEYMRNIEKEINVNFENYYQEAKDSNEVEQQNESLSSEESFDATEILKERAARREGQTQTSTIEEKAIEQINIIVCTPKIIEIQIPCIITKIIPIRHSESPEKLSSSSEPLSINSHPNKHKVHKSSNYSSIQQIINQFNDNFYGSLDDEEDEKLVYNYRIKKVEQPESIEIAEKEEFHLPLDSYERCASEKGEKNNMHLLKKTDRSNISSSNSELQNLRNQIWNKDELEFNHEHLSLVKEYQQKSEHNSDQYILESEVRERLLIELNEKISTLKEENLTLRNRIEEMDAEQNQLLQQVKTLENKNIEIEIAYLEEVDKVEEVVESNNVLQSQIQNYKQLVAKHQSREYDFEEKIKQLDKQFILKLDEKQSQLHESLKNIHEKTEQNEEYAKMHEQIKKLLQKKEEEHEHHIADLQAAVQELKQQVMFYKSKLEQEGINLKFEEANMLKELIEKKEQDEQQNLLVIERRLESKYKSKLDQLKLDKQRIHKELEQLKKASCKFSLGSIEWLPAQLKNSLEIDVHEFFSNYNCELFKKEEEITELRKLSSQYKQQLTQNSSTSEEELKIITSIKNILIKEKMDKENISNNLVQFVYVIDRLLRNIKVCEYAVHREKEERLKLTKKITNLNLFFNRQLQKSEEANLKLEKESAKNRQKMHQANKQVKKLTKKLQIYRSKLQDPHSNQLYNVFQLQNQYLLMQNKKLLAKYDKIKQYSEQIEGKFVADFLKTESNPNQYLATPAGKEELRQEEQFSKKISEILVEMKDQYNKSVLFAGQESFFQSKSKFQNFGINSSVISVTNNPSKPSKHAKNPVIKALFAPLPEIPNSSPTPNASITLDKLLQKRLCTSDIYKQKVTLKLLELGIELNKVAKKLFTLSPCQILVNYSNGEVDIILRRQFGNSMEEDQNSLIYRAPEVLLGFTETESSYVWTIGLIIDQIFHEKLFYRKINEVLSHKNNYYVRNEGLKVRPILQKMLRKNHKERPTLIQAKENLLQLIL